MRQGELFGLEWRDIDLYDGVLWVRRTLNEINGRFLTGPPKTKRGLRRIRLPQVAISALRQHHQLRTADGQAETLLVFCDQAGGPLRRQNLLRRSFKPQLKSAQCPDIRFHDLRHTYATMALASGVPLRVVSDTLAHCRSSVTIDTYAHVLPSQERAAADAMDAAFGDVG